MKERIGTEEEIQKILDEVNNEFNAKLKALTYSNIRKIKIRGDIEKLRLLKKDIETVPFWNCYIDDQNRLVVCHMLRFTLPWIDILERKVKKHL